MRRLATAPQRPSVLVEVVKDRTRVTALSWQVTPAFQFCEAGGRRGQARARSSPYAPPRRSGLGAARDSAAGAEGDPGVFE